jgi:hypothetical protein
MIVPPPVDTEDGNYGTTQYVSPMYCIDIICIDIIFQIYCVQILLYLCACPNRYARYLSNEKVWVGVSEQTGRVPSLIGE